MSSRFAILRVQKVKSMDALKMGLRHVFREQDTPNADPAQTHQNTALVVNSTRAGMTRAASIIPAKRRKDAVIALEYMVTASPEALKAMDEDERYEYFNGAWKWLVAKHGAENVIGAAVHRDETTEHMHVFVVPMLEGRLCAQQHLGGPKGLAKMQDDFAREVGAPAGLERGSRKSKRSHTKIREWYDGQNVLEASLEAALETIKELGPEATRRYSEKYAAIRARQLEAESVAEPEAELATDWGSYQPGR